MFRSRSVYFICFFIFLLQGCATTTTSMKSPEPPFDVDLLRNHQQAVVVESISGVRAKVTPWEFKKGIWHPVSGAIAATVGRNGIAPKDAKREGDGRTPSGIYDLRLAFGYDPSVTTNLNYRQATDNDFWVDDPKSIQYNQWVIGQPQTASFEYLRRKDDLYKIAIVIEYNTQPVVPGHGSAIFMHIWKGEGEPTSGCVAFSENNLRKLLSWLDLRRKPVIIILEPKST